MVNEIKINEVVSRIALNYQPEKIILFGSYAFGNPTEDSDLDFIIIKDTDTPSQRRGREVRKFLYRTMVPMDLLVYTPKEFEKDEVIKAWIEKADHDLGAAVLVHQHLPDYRDTIAFHCQQATEKYIKSLFIFFEIEVKRIHNLIALLDIIDEKETISELLFDRAAELEDYGVKIRYPDKIIQLSDEDICNAIKIVREFREFAIKRMNIIDEVDSHKPKK